MIESYRRIYQVRAAKHAHLVDFQTIGRTTKLIAEDGDAAPMTMWTGMGTRRGPAPQATPTRVAKKVRGAALQQGRER